MAGLDSNAPPVVEQATTNRSKCQSCKEQLEAGALRVGMVGRHSGISCRKWLHPQCFCDNILVDYAPTNRATCKIDGSDIAKGEPRLLFRLIGCDGKVQSTQIMRPVAGHQQFQKFVELEGTTLTAETVPGLEMVDPAHRAWFVDALSGRDVSGCEVPMLEPPSKPLKRSAPEDAGEKKPKKEKKMKAPAPVDDDEEEDADVVD